MKPIRLTMLSMVALLIAAAAGAPAQAQESLVTFKVLSPETAAKAARAALTYCRKKGFQVSVAVVDRMGIVQVILRDRFAGPHTPDTARKKAWTATTFRTSTREVAKLAQPNKPGYGLRGVPGALVLGGGVPVQAGGTLVGGIGVSGAPDVSMDEECARAGITAIETEINL